jgi:hypothetical protein
MHARAHTHTNTPAQNALPSEAVGKDTSRDRRARHANTWMQCRECVRVRAFVSLTTNIMSGIAFHRMFARKHINSTQPSHGNRNCGLWTRRACMQRRRQLILSDACTQGNLGCPPQCRRILRFQYSSASARTASYWSGDHTKSVLVTLYYMFHSVRVGELRQKTSLTCPTCPRPRR